MRQTTERLRDEVSRLTRIIRQIESKPRTERTVWAATLRELRAELRSLDRVIRFRYAEAAKKIVDLRRWRDGPAGRRSFT